MLLKVCREISRFVGIVSAGHLVALMTAGLGGGFGGVEKVYIFQFCDESLVISPPGFTVIFFRFRAGRAREMVASGLVWRCCLVLR